MRRRVWGIVLPVCLLVTGCLKVGDEELSDIRLQTQASVMENDMGKTEAVTETAKQIEVEITWEAETESRTETEDQEEPEAAWTHVFQTGETLSVQLQQINEKTRRQAESGVVDLFEQDWTPEQVMELIEQYVFPDYPYLSGEPVTEETRREITENRNLEALKQQGELRVTYGLLTDNASVRSFPTAKRITANPQESQENYDYFQETVLLCGEAVAVLHISLDGKYSFVQGKNYCGWIQTELIQNCTFELAKQLGQIAEFAVITDNFYTCAGKNEELLLRMGTRLPLLSETDDAYQVLLPCGAGEADGFFMVLNGELCYRRLGDMQDVSSVLWVRKAEIEKESASPGFLAFTKENIILQAEKMIGSSYSWGDELAGYDCSSTVGSIYRCFGLILPRNSGTLRYTGAAVEDVSSMSESQKRSYITGLPEGSILIVPGHVLMYIGERQLMISGQPVMTPAVLHCVTGYVDLDGTLQQPFGCVETALDINTRGGSPYLELICYCISFPVT